MTRAFAFARRVMHGESSGVEARAAGGAAKTPSALLRRPFERREPSPIEVVLGVEPRERANPAHARVCRNFEKRFSRCFFSRRPPFRAVQKKKTHLEFRTVNHLSHVNVNQNSCVQL